MNTDDMKEELNLWEMVYMYGIRTVKIFLVFPCFCGDMF